MIDCWNFDLSLRSDSAPDAAAVTVSSCDAMQKDWIKLGDDTKSEQIDKQPRHITDQRTDTSGRASGRRT